MIFAKKSGKACGFQLKVRGIFVNKSICGLLHHRVGSCLVVVDSPVQ